MRNVPISIEILHKGRCGILIQDVLHYLRVRQEPNCLSSDVINRAPPLIAMWAWVSYLTYSVSQFQIYTASLPLNNFTYTSKLTCPKTNSSFSPPQMWSSHSFPQLNKRKLLLPKASWSYLWLFSFSHIAHSVCQQNPLGSTLKLYPQTDCSHWLHPSPPSSLIWTIKITSTVVSPFPPMPLRVPSPQNI